LELKPFEEGPTDTYPLEPEWKATRTSPVAVRIPRFCTKRFADPEPPTISEAPPVNDRRLLWEGKPPTPEMSSVADAVGSDAISMVPVAGPLRSQM
jgi:hypothetical protein